MTTREFNEGDFPWVTVKIFDNKELLKEVGMHFDSPLWSIGEKVNIRLTSLGLDASCDVVEVVHEADEEGPVSTTLILCANSLHSFR